MFFVRSITGWNIHLLTKSVSCSEEEVINDFPFCNFLKGVDGKNWRLHLRICKYSRTRELMITGGKVDKVRIAVYLFFCEQAKVGASRTFAEMSSDHGFR